jgi:hypothetical protein
MAKLSDKDVTLAIAGVLERHVVQGTTPPAAVRAPDPVLDTLAAAVDAFNRGKSTESIREDVGRIMVGQTKRAEVVNGIMQAHDLDRLVRLTRAADINERVIVELAERPDLSTLERLALHQVLSTERDKVAGRVRSNAIDVKDLAALLLKTDAVVQQTNEETIRRFSTTTPQGREIIRRVTSTMIKVRAATDSQRPQTEVMHD